MLVFYVIYLYLYFIVVIQWYFVIIINAYTLKSETMLVIAAEVNNLWIIALQHTQLWFSLFSIIYLLTHTNLIVYITHTILLIINRFISQSTMDSTTTHDFSAVTPEDICTLINNTLSGDNQKIASSTKILKAYTKHKASISILFILLM